MIWLHSEPRHECCVHCELTASPRCAADAAGLAQQDPLRWDGGADLVRSPSEGPLGFRRASAGAHLPVGAQAAGLEVRYGAARLLSVCLSVVCLSVCLSSVEDWAVETAAGQTTSVTITVTSRAAGKCPAVSKPQ